MSTTNGSPMLNPNPTLAILDLHGRNHSRASSQGEGTYVMHRCQHCDNAPCMKAAPDAVYKREDGLVIIDPVKAEGKRELVDACPYGAIFWNEELSIPQKCTGCAHLVDEGELPHCVDVCPHEALRFGDEEDFADEIAKAEAIVPSGPPVTSHACTI